MREFRVYEYVDGDVKVWVRTRGQGDDAWQTAARVKFEERGPIDAQVNAIEQHMNTTLEPEERRNLGSELAWPRRW